MKEMRKIIITVLLVGLSLITVAAADRTMSVSQQPTGIAINDTFTAEVTVYPAGGEIYAASYDLYFDATILEAIKQTQGDFLSKDGAETLEMVNEFNNTIGKITYVETRTGDDGATEPGVLASITFKVIGTGISDLELRNVQFVDLTAEPEPTQPPESTAPEPTDDDDTTSSHSPSGGSSGYIAAPAATSTETATVSAASTGDDSSAIGDDDSPSATDETDSAAAESTPAASHTKTPSRPKSVIPGFAAMFTIVGLLIVAYIIRRRGE